jgi:hypothetical protein
MEHIIKDTDLETIKRFELNGKDIWIVREYHFWGIGATKKAAYDSLFQDTIKQQVYANQGVPNFMYDIGSIDKTNNRLAANSLPSFVNFIWGMLPISWQSKYIFRPIISQDAPQQTYLEITTLDPETEPLRLFSTNSEGPHAQIRDCIYQFYLELEKGFKFKKQNKKLGEWQKNCYNKLQPRRIG